jgi:hypothetical protein
LLDMETLTPPSMPDSPPRGVDTPVHKLAGTPMALYTQTHTHAWTCAHADRHREEEEETEIAGEVKSG